MAFIDDVLSQAVVPAFRSLFDGRDPPKVDQALVLGTGLVESGYRALAQRKVVPGARPTLLPSWSASCWVAVIVSSIFRSCSATRAVSSLMHEAGRCRACGSCAATTAPLSRSASIR